MGKRSGVKEVIDDLYIASRNRNGAINTIQFNDVGTPFFLDCCHIGYVHNKRAMTSYTIVCVQVGFYILQRIPYYFPADTLIFPEKDNYIIVGGFKIDQIFGTQR